LRNKIKEEPASFEPRYFQDIHPMKYELEPNEFTSWDILEYLKIVYGTQVNGSPFTSINMQNWIRNMKLPEFYGGFEIIDARRYKELNNLLILTIEGLNRAEVCELVGSLTEFTETQNKRRALDSSPKLKRPRKQRTNLYYKILADAGKRYTKRTLNGSILPDDWKGAGIKGNQLISRKKRKSEV